MASPVPMMSPTRATRRDPEMVTPVPQRPETNITNIRGPTKADKAFHRTAANLPLSPSRVNPSENESVVQGAHSQEQMLAAIRTRERLLTDMTFRALDLTNPAKTIKDKARMIMMQDVSEEQQVRHTYIAHPRA